MIDDLTVLIGIDPKGDPVRPAEAKKGVLYKCPACSELLILRQGKIRIHHFSHRSDTQCSHESRLHKSAKAVISKLIRDRVSGVGEGPKIHLKHDHCSDATQIDLPSGITGVREEYRLPSGRVLDVAILKGEEVLLGVEIYVTHRVDDAKKASLECPWVELHASTVITMPFHWVCLAQARAFPWCSVCEKILKDCQARERAVAQALAPLNSPPWVLGKGNRFETEGIPTSKIEPYPEAPRANTRPALQILLDGGPLCVAHAWDWRGDHSRRDLFRVYHKKLGTSVGPFYTSIGLAETGMRKAIKLGKHLWEGDIAEAKWLHKWADEHLGKPGDLVGGHWAPDPEDGK